MKKYRDKYRIPSARLQTWDYTSPGAYFITICTKNMIHYFGKVQHGKMILSPTGTIANILWHEIKNHNTNIELGEFIIMPNHMHGILIIPQKPAPGNPTHSNPTHPDAVQTRHALSVSPSPQSESPSPQSESPSPQSESPSPQSESPSPISPGKKRFRNPQKNSIPSIVGGYKSAVTRHARRLGFDFAWQTRYWDHIIRNQKAFQNISNYIINNPQKWTDDKFNGGKGNEVLEPQARYGEEDWKIYS